MHCSCEYGHAELPIIEIVEDAPEVIEVLPARLDTNARRIYHIVQIFSHLCSKLLAKKGTNNGRLIRVIHLDRLQYFSVAERYQGERAIQQCPWISHGCFERG